MSDNINQYDATSDELIEILVDNRKSPAEREKASQQLYHRHTDWITKQIRRRIYDPDDVQDIAQNVWMQVLQPEKLNENYKKRDGKFRAYLHAPIRWAILKHIDKLPFTIDESGEKTQVYFTEIDESALELGLDREILEEVVENIIKPNLHRVEITPRNVYMVNEYETIFDSDPSLSEVADINGISVSNARTLFDQASARSPGSWSEHEASVYLPVSYRSLVDPAELKKSSGRYLAKLLNLKESTFRKHLHLARKYLIEIVRKELAGIRGNIDHG